MCEEDTRVTDKLTEKIRSKMDVTKFFTGFITLLIGFVLDAKHLTTPFADFGTLCLISSLGFFVAAMFTYDHLLWPKEHFDKSRDKISEANFQEYLATNMVSSWKSLFVPAVILFGCGLFCLLIQELGLASWSAYRENTRSLIWKVFLCVALVVAAVLPALCCWVRWPRMNKA